MKMHLIEDLLECRGWDISSSHSGPSVDFSSLQVHLHSHSRLLSVPFLLICASGNLTDKLAWLTNILNTYIFSWEPLFIKFYILFITRHLHHEGVEIDIIGKSDPQNCLSSDNKKCQKPSWPICRLPLVMDRPKWPKGFPGQISFILLRETPCPEFQC